MLSQSSRIPERAFNDQPKLRPGSSLSQDRILPLVEMSDKLPREWGVCDWDRALATRELPRINTLLLDQYLRRRGRYSNNLSRRALRYST